MNTSFIGSIPANYNRYLGPLLFIPYAEDIAQRVPANVQSILELACGTGLVTAQLVKKFSESVKIIATDLNPDMISVAKENVVDSRIEWQTADMLQLPFADNSFDCVVCQFGIMFVPDKLKAFQEVYRVLKKGGYFFFSTWDRIETCGAFAIGNKVIQEFFGDKAPSFFQTPYSMFDPEELKRLLRDSKFLSSKVELLKKTGHGETSMHAAKGLVEGNPIYKEIMSIDPTAVDVLKEKISNQLQVAYGKGSLQHSMQAFVAEGMK